MKIKINIKNIHARRNSLLSRAIDKRLVRKIVSAVTIGSLVISAMPNVAFAAILFQDDTFDTVYSDAIIIGSNDAGARSTAIQFGADGASTQNGNILYDIGTRMFSIDHPVVINNITANDPFRVNNSVGSTTPFIIEKDGDVLIGSDTPLAGDPSRLQVEATAGQARVINGAGDVNDNLYMVTKNRNSGNLATSLFVAEADNSPSGGDPLYTTVFGMTSSTFNNPAYTIAGPDDGFVVLPFRGHPSNLPQEA
jgi:hypothetical protein